MRYLALIMLAAVAVSAYSCGGCRCGKKSGDATASGAAGTTIAADPLAGDISGDTLKVEVDLTERCYALLEPLVMALTVTNVKGKNLTLTFPTAQRYDFIVRKGKLVVWRWSEGMMFAQAIGRKTLKAGESISYEITWDQTGLENMKPPLGTYSVQGVLKTVPEIVSEERVFGIVD
jgi:hypothetical protein